VEIKNLNSSRFVRLGLNYEIQRQGLLLDAGKPVMQETRLWNQNRDQTEPLRTKENAQDYRYFPEPDLPVFAPEPEFLASVEAGLVELPLPRRKRFEAEYGLPFDPADLLCQEKALADYFEEAVEAVRAQAPEISKTDAAGRVANWVLTDLKHLLSRAGLSLEEIGLCRANPRRLGVLVALTESGRVSMKNGKQTLAAVMAEDREPESIIAGRGWEQLTDPGALREAVRGVFAAEPETLADLRAALAEGNKKRSRTLRAYLVGKTLEATGGRGDPKIAVAQIEAMLAGN
jgi:aspartyl-tRNA(Asn)/glutamyl-tRNA(Gln) amidotransferase subunit B